MINVAMWSKLFPLENKDDTNDKGIFKPQPVQNLLKTESHHHSRKHQIQIL